MKTITLILSFIIVSTVAYSQAKTAQATIKVYGNCGMCKKRIETALDTKGIKQATWDSKTKDLQLIYVPSKITEMEIHQLVAAVGQKTGRKRHP